MEPLHFYYPNRKLLIRAFQWYLGWRLGQKIDPKPANLPIVTLPSQAASVFSVSLTKIYSAFSQPRPALKPYHQFVHGLNSLFVWLQCRLWSADSVVSWQQNTLPDRCQEGWIGRGYFHLLEAPSEPPWHKRITRMHRLDLVLRRVRHKHHIGRCLCSSGEDVSAMRQWCIVH